MQTRAKLLLAGIAALLPGIGAAAALARTPAGHPFDPPADRFELTRTVTRELHDGAAIVARRRYLVRIVRDPAGDGFIVTGELLGAEVEAPRQLALLARLERDRPDSGLFPIRLDAGGLIRPDAQPEPAAAHEAARAVGAEVLGGAPGLAPAAREQAGAMLVQLSAGAATPWPADLFNPAIPRQHEHRTLALPGGEDGTVDTAITATGDGPGSLPALVERTVVSRLAGSARRSREVWTLAPTASPRP